MVQEVCEIESKFNEAPRVFIAYEDPTVTTRGLAPVTSPKLFSSCGLMRTPGA
jgi:hypothetical protein